MTLFRRALVAVLAILTILPFTVSQAHAAPATKAEVSTAGKSVIVKIANGGIAVEGNNLVVRNTAGEALETYPLNFIAPDNRTYPIDASVKGKTATLVPSTNVARSTKTDPELLAKTQVADRNGYKSKRERDDAALNRLNSEMAAGGTISALIGTAVGAVLGGLLATALCVIPATATALMALMICIPVGATVGGIVGTVVIGGPAALVSIARYFETINQPFKHVR